MLSVCDERILSLLTKMSEMREVQNTSSQENPKANIFQDGGLWFKISLPFCVVITVANSIALAVFLKKSFLVKKSTYLLVNLTFADLLVGLSGLLTSLLHMPIPASYDKVIRLIYWGSFKMSSVASGCSLAAISLERMFAVFFPFHHRLSRRWYCFTAIGFVWLFAGFLTMTYILKSLISTSFFDRLYNYTLFILNFNLVLAITISYLSIWIKLTFFSKFHRSRTMQENGSLSKTLCIMTVVSLASWLPKTTERFLQFNRPDLDIPDSIVAGVTAGLLLNSILNIVVYLFRMPEFRRELGNLFRRS